MPHTAPELFSANGARFLAESGLTVSADEHAIHQALATRTLTPDEIHLRAAAAWLHKLFVHNLQQHTYDSLALADVLAEKSALVLRMAYQHVPPLAAELERPDSPLHAINATARFMSPAPPATSRQLSELRQTMAVIALPADPPPGTDATWHANRRRLQHLILHDNPLRFLSWPVVLNSMFMNDPHIAGPELATLQARPDFAARWLPALREDALGTPARTPLHPDTSNNLLHHAYNLLQLELHAHMPVERLTSILEFGGGYGSTARLAFRLGFRGQYVIFDLPEFSALQRFYLTTLGFPVENHSPDTRGTIHLTTTLEQLHRLLPAPDLFLATWSLSETPAHFRPNLQPFIRNARHLLIAYQEYFANVDNHAYFTTLAPQLSPHLCQDYPIPHLPANRYLVACPKP